MRQRYLLRLWLRRALVPNFGRHVVLDRGATRDTAPASDAGLFTITEAAVPRHDRGG